MAVALTQNLNHTAEALALLPEQFKNNVEMRAMIKSWMTQIQALETACFQVLNNRHLATAVGKQLDVLGRIVGVKREGRSDARYRIRLRAQIKLNRCSGTISQILDLLNLIIESGQTVELREHYPAAIAVLIDGTPTASVAVAEETARILKQARAAGVKSDLTYSTELDANTFHWNGTVGQGWNAGYWAHSTEG